MERTMPDRDDGSTRDDDAFVAHVAAPLRAPERVNATFGERVMSMVHADVRAGRATHHQTSAPSTRAWWHRGLTLRLTPIAALAAAAAIAALAALGVSVSAGHRGPAHLAMVAQRDTVY